MVEEIPSKGLGELIDELIELEVGYSNMPKKPVPGVLRFIEDYSQKKKKLRYEINEILKKYRLKEE